MVYRTPRSQSLRVGGAALARRPIRFFHLKPLAEILHNGRQR